jgi:hypothetical protein
MNYYAQGGQAHGLKALAQELPQYGRYNDDMVAHISSDEAKLLKSLGGSGTINPTTGLPEFGFGSWNPVKIINNAVNSIPVVGDINKALEKGATQIFQPVEKAIVQPASAGLAQFDKAVGKTIPGGWGTVGMVAGSMIPGMTPLMMGGLGAINGSGVLRKGNKFNLQGAMMGGAMAYGMSSLAQYAQGAATTPDMSGATAPASGGITPPPVDAIESLNASQGWTGPNATDVGSSIPQNSINAANNAAQISADAASRINPATGLDYSATGSGLVGNGAQPSIGSQVMRGEFGNAATQLGQNVQQSAYNAYNSLGDFANKAITPSTYDNALSNYGANVAKTGEGAYNLITGAPGASAAAAANATAQGIASPMTAAGATIYGGMGLAALEEQKKYLEESKAANAISQAEYDSAMAEINRSSEDASRAVRESPFSTNPNRDVSIGETFYGRGNEIDNLYSRLSGEARTYAIGGSVDDEYGMDEARGLMQGNLQNGLFAKSMPSYAAGGQPRFLSGGGDGMSDDIPATIEGKQEARLADGEFVVPADVVSHLGNGSSKAGAKQLYSMMDKVRSARTGTKQQGKQINPRKYLAA